MLDAPQTLVRLRPAEVPDQWVALYRFDAEDRPYALKLFGPGISVETLRAEVWKHRKMFEIAGGGDVFSVPQIRHVFPRKGGVLMDFLDGRTGRDLLNGHKAQEPVLAFLKQAGQTLRAIHDYGGREALVPDMTGMLNMIEATRDLPRPMDQLRLDLLLLWSHWPKQPVDHVLLHGDAHLGNFLSRQGGLSMLDFSNLQKGPAIWDVDVLMSDVLRRGFRSDLTYRSTSHGYRPKLQAAFEAGYGPLPEPTPDMRLVSGTRLFSGLLTRVARGTDPRGRKIQRLFRLCRGRLKPVLKAR